MKKENKSLDKGHAIYEKIKESDEFYVVNKENGTMQCIDIDVFFRGIEDSFEKIDKAILGKFYDSSSKAESKLLSYMLDSKTKDNYLICTQSSIANKTQIARCTVINTFKRLTNENLLKKLKIGCYMIHPDVSYYGSIIRKAKLLELWNKG